MPSVQRGTTNGRRAPSSLSADDRLTRLRTLVAQLERLPASPKTEWMLAQARARLVDVETGETPQALRPLDVGSPVGAPGPPAQEAADAAQAERPRQHAPKAPEPLRAPPAQPSMAAVEALEPDDGEAPKDAAAPVAPSDFGAAVFGVDGLLSLEDAPAHDPPADDGEPRSRPWRRGLRG